jgi:hypothetical protein
MVPFCKLNPYYILKETLREELRRDVVIRPIRVGSEKKDVGTASREHVEISTACWCGRGDSNPQALAGTRS